MNDTKNKKWVVNRCDENGNIITGYEEVLEGTIDEVEKDYRHHHELVDDDKIDIEEYILEK